MKTKESKFVNHYSDEEMAAMGIVMCERFNLYLRDFIKSSVRGVDIKEVCVVNMVYSRCDVYSLRDGVVVGVAVKYQRKSIIVDVHVRYGVDDYGQQSFKYKLESIHLGS